LKERLAKGIQARCFHFSKEPFGSAVRLKVVAAVINTSARPWLKLPSQLLGIIGPKADMEPEHINRTAELDQFQLRCFR